MKLFALLLRNRILGTFAAMKRNPKTGKPRGAGFFVLIALLAVYVIGVFLALFFGLFVGLATVLFPLAEARWLYFAVAGILSVLLGFVGSVFATVSQLYEAKDNELLLSMPIPPRTVLASRMVALLLYNFAFELVVMLPALLVYFIFGAMEGVITLGGTLVFLLGILAFPFFSLALSAAVGYLVALVLRRVRNKALVQSALSLLFLGLYFFLYFGFLGNSETIFDNFSAILAPILDGVKSYAYPFYLFGLGADGGLLWGILSLLLLAVPTLLVFFLVSVTFIRFTTGKTGVRRVKYKKKAIRTASPVAALTRKEISHLFHSSAYLINSALGIILLLVASVALPFLNIEGVIADMGLTGISRDTVAAVLALLTVGILSFNFITAPSLSLEARTLALLKSYPLSGREVLGGKVLAQTVLCAPVTLLASVSILLVARPSVLTALGVLLLPQIASLAFALLGMLFGTLFPRFVWNSEAEAVKQGMAVLLAMLGNMLLCGVFALLGILVWLVLGSAVALLGLTLLSLAVCALLGWLVFVPMARRYDTMLVP